MNSIPLISNGDQLNAEWLRNALSSGGKADWSGVDDIEIEKLSDESNAFGTLFRCRAVDVAQDEMNAASVIVKMPTVDALRFKFGKWLAMYLREFVFYQDIAPETDLGVPAMLYGDFDERSHRFILLLEDRGDLTTVPQLEGVDAEYAFVAIEAIARFQGQFWDKPNDRALANCVEFLNTGMRRTMQTIYMLSIAVTLDRFGELFSDAMRQLALDFGSRIDTQFANVAKGPLTVVHGDFRSENMMFDLENPENFVVIDWQGCSLGCGMFDVSYFLGTSVSVDTRRRIEREALARYHELVCQAGATDYTLEDCWRSYRQNMLGSLTHCVIGCGALEMSNEYRLNNSIELLRRITTAIDDLDAGDLLPDRAPHFSSTAVYSALARTGYRTVSLGQRLRRRKPK